MNALDRLAQIEAMDLPEFLQGQAAVSDPNHPIRGRALNKAAKEVEGLVAALRAVLTEVEAWKRVPPVDVGVLRIEAAITEILS
ncbi:hypothetical protein [Georgenia thermotolerans]|uniref:hypothetical protein n=1 Tax=Georgenia thermotolerans TaxID=527326 RepID=UPI001264A899|nr:hypothetical protein [Georgenia thermotolerans]